MTLVRADFLIAARAAAELVRAPAVAAAWREPSALADFNVGGLATHLGFQVLIVRQLLAAPPATEPTVSLLDHYGQAPWVGADLDAEANVGMRRGSEEQAKEGHEAVVAKVDEAIAELTDTLAAVPNQPARMPFWGPYSLLLDDFVTTRLMELAVHSDDLAVSVGVPTPELPQSAVDTVIDLLSRIAVRRHGATSVLRALSRAERAPASITAF